MAADRPFAAPRRSGARSLSTLRRMKPNCTTASEPGDPRDVVLPAPLNPLQRWVMRRSLARYARLPAALRPVAIERDRFLLSPRAAGVWVGTACGIAGTTYGLAADPDSLSPWLAFAFALLTFGGLFKAGMSAWLYPQRFRGRRLWGLFGIVLIATYAGALASFGTRLHAALAQGMPYPQALLRVVWRATPLQFVALAGVLVVLAAVAASRQQLLQRERELRERDAIAAQAAQARLSLLQAQIQPHFLFNTLAALQHWVDAGDPRAAPLLRSLTGFLRGSTEHMLQAQTTLAQEFAMAGHYLDIMAARLGPRLRRRIDLDPDCAAQPVPPGLVVTLVENAIEHGIEPQLRGGTVELSARRLDAAAGGPAAVELRVRDDGAGLSAAAQDGVGLSNSRERLRRTFGDTATLVLAARDDGAPGADALARWPAAAPPG